MDIRFRPYELATIDDTLRIAAWDADPAIRHLLMPFKDEKAYRRVASAEEVWAKQKDRASPGGQEAYRSEEWIILVDGKTAGAASVQIDPPHLLSILTVEGDSPRTAWFGITIGEPWARGKGVGKETLRFLEDRARALGATQAEAGVFEFNAPSIRLFTGAGYRSIGKIAEFTWWDGRMWDDLRFLKEL